MCNFGLTILFCQACAEPINSICEEELSKFESSRLALMQGRRKHEALVERFVVGFISETQIVVLPETMSYVCALPAHISNMSDMNNKCVESS